MRKRSDGMRTVRLINDLNSLKRMIKDEKKEKERNELVQSTMNFHRSWAKRRNDSLIGLRRVFRFDLSLFSSLLLTEIDRSISISIANRFSSCRARLNSSKPWHLLLSLSLILFLSVRLCFSLVPECCAGKLLSNTHFREN